MHDLWHWDSYGKGIFSLFLKYTTALNVILHIIVQKNKRKPHAYIYYVWKACRHLFSFFVYPFWVDSWHQRYCISVYHILYNYNHIVHYNYRDIRGNPDFISSPSQNMMILSHSLSCTTKLMRLWYQMINKNAKMQ